MTQFIGANSTQDILQILDEILTQPKEVNLTIEYTKLKLYLFEIDFLGYKINQIGHVPSVKYISNTTKILFEPLATKDGLTIFLLCFRACKMKTQNKNIKKHKTYNFFCNKSTLLLADT